MEGFSSRHILIALSPLGTPNTPNRTVPIAQVVKIFMAETVGGKVEEAKFPIWRRFLEYLPNAAPREPTDEVKALISATKLAQNDVSSIFQVYQRLRWRDGTLRTKTKQITLRTSAVIELVADNRLYISTLLRNIMQLGGCYEYIDWNHFLFIFVRFCSMTKVELCQLMFLIIVRESRGLDVHYLSATQLDMFYEIYRTGHGDIPSDALPLPVSMQCNRIHFSNFPLPRYYVTDFVEICFLYNPLINPLIYLQRQIQRVLPTLRFWDAYENLSLVGSRKISLDFFLMHANRVTIGGEEPFKETCDLLLLGSQLMQSKRKLGMKSVSSINQQDSGASARGDWSKVLGQMHIGGNGASSEIDDEKAEAIKERQKELDFLSKPHSISPINDASGLYKVKHQSSVLMGSNST